MLLVGSILAGIKSNNIFLILFWKIYLEYALLDVFPSIYDVANYHHDGDDHEGDQRAVSKIFSINIWIIVAKLGCSG